MHFKRSCVPHVVVISCQLNSSWRFDWVFRSMPDLQRRATTASRTGQTSSCSEGVLPSGAKERKCTILTALEQITRVFFFTLNRIFLEIKRFEKGYSVLWSCWNIAVQNSTFIVTLHHMEHPSIKKKSILLNTGPILNYILIQKWLAFHNNWFENG